MYLEIWNVSLGHRLKLKMWLEIGFRSTNLGTTFQQQFSKIKYVLELGEKVLHVIPASIWENWCQRWQFTQKSDKFGFLPIF